MWCISVSQDSPARQAQCAPARSPPTAHHTSCSMHRSAGRTRDSQANRRANIPAATEPDGIWDTARRTELTHSGEDHSMLRTRFDPHCFATHSRISPQPPLLCGDRFNRVLSARDHPTDPRMTREIRQRGEASVAHNVTKTRRPTVPQPHTGPRAHNCGREHLRRSRESQPTSNRCKDAGENRLRADTPKCP